MKRYCHMCKQKIKGSRFEVHCESKKPNQYICWNMMDDYVFCVPCYIEILKFIENGELLYDFNNKRKKDT